MLRKLSSPIQEFGWAAGSLYLLHRVLQQISTRLGLCVYEMMMQPIGTKPLLPANLAKGFRYAEIPHGHPDLALMPAREDIKQQRFAQGAVCLGTYRAEQLVGYIWFCFDQYLEDEVRCTYVMPEATTVFDFDLYVMPEHRMGLTFPAIWHGANEYLHARGVRFTFSRLTRFNTASRRAHAHLRWVRVAKVVFLKAWSAEFMVATAPPYLGFTWAEPGRITLNLRSDRVSIPAPPLTKEKLKP